MSLALTVRSMLNAGCSAEQIVVVVEQWEANWKARPAKPQGRRVAYTEDFEAFWKAYPTDANMSKQEAFDVWKRIGDEDKRLAMEAVPKFVAWCKTQPDYRPIHACRFLSKKRYEGHAQTKDLRLVAGRDGTYVMRDSPEWGRFAEAYKAEKGKYPPVDSKGGWFFSVDKTEKSAPDGEAGVLFEGVNDTQKCPGSVGSAPGLSDATDSQPAPTLAAK